jgi:hypothetical protein
LPQVAALYAAAEIFNEVMYSNRWERLKTLITDVHCHLDTLNEDIRRLAAT